MYCLKCNGLGYITEWDHSNYDEELEYRCDACDGTGFKPIPYALTEFAERYGIDFREPREGDAGYDLYCADEGHFIDVGEQVFIKTGVHLEIPSGCVGIAKDRSSMAGKGLKNTW